MCRKLHVHNVETSCYLLFGVVAPRSKIFLSEERRMEDHASMKSTTRKLTTNPARKNVDGRKNVDHFAASSSMLWFV